MTLEEILNQYKELRETFRHYTKHGEPNKHTLIEFQSQFNDLKAELRLHKNSVLGKWIKRDDKAATALKYRIAIAIHEGKFVDLDEDGNETIKFDSCSINQAEKFASGTNKYKKFIEQRSFYKESYLNLADLREDITNFINEIKDRLKT